jgi:hypothetical protein
MQTSLRLCATAAIGSAIVLTASLFGVADAGQKVGVAAAVKLDATSQPPVNWNWGRQLLAVRPLTPAGISRVGPQTAASMTPAIAEAKHDKMLCYRRG